MLDGYGLHQLTWDTCDERFGDVLVASPADALGRGISLAVRQNGAAANLTGATVYLVWRHKVTGERGTEPFTAVDAAGGTFSVYYPAAMQEAEGAVQAQVMVSRGNDTYISSRVFTIRVEPVIVGGGEHEDGFTLFVDAINAYEHATEITTDAADAANAAAEAADTARENLVAAAERGDFDGADGQDGADGFSPVATVTQTSDGATITITDKNGTTTANVAKGAKGDKGDTGATGPKGDKGDTGERGPQGIQGETGPKGDKGDARDRSAGTKGRYRRHRCHWCSGAERRIKGDTGATGATGPQGPKGETGDTGPKGDTGAAGADGSDGVSCTHSWNGTVLSVTSASGTSSADLVGPQGPTGATGATGPAGADGADGTVFTPISPLSLSNGELSVDLTNYAPVTAVKHFHDATSFAFLPAEQTNANYSASSGAMKAVNLGDYLYDTRRNRVALVTACTKTASTTSFTARTVYDFSGLQGMVETTTVDADPGEYVNGQVGRAGHAISAGTLVLNTSTGNLMRVTANVNPISGSTLPEARLLGLCNLLGSGMAYTAASPLSIDSNDEISIDLSAYAALAGATFTGAVSGIAPTADANFATKKYVDDAIAALDDLSGVSF